MQDSGKLAGTGKEGLLKEMIKKATDTGKDYFTANELTKGGSERNPSQTRKYLEELVAEGKVELVKKLVEQKMYKPDPVNPDLSEQGFLGPLLFFRDVTRVVTNAPDNLIYECHKCGRLQRYLPVNLLVPLGHLLPVMCKYCDRLAAYLTYTSQFIGE